MPQKPSRRHFLATASAIAGAAALPAIADLAAAQGGAPQGGWDLSFLDRLNGRHKQVFDLTDPMWLVVVRNWYDAFDSVFSLKHPEVNAIVAIAGPAFPVNASDELWQKLPIGEEFKINDPATGKPAERNIYLDSTVAAAQPNTVRALQARGALFWMCNNALRNVSGRLAARTGRPAPEIYAQLRAGLNPGVVVVPAHTMLLTLAQERGFTYEAL